MIAEQITFYNNQLPEEVKLVAVSKTKPVEDLMEAYNAGQRIFGENKIQEMAEKWEQMPKDIEWHMIGHVQTNKVKYMAPFVSLIHAVDSLKLLKEINKHGKNNERIISCLLQIKIASEDSKFGLSQEDAKKILTSEIFNELTHVKVVGLMGMATFTDDQSQITSEFKTLKNCFDTFKKEHSNIKELSMGMSGDYQLAIKEGSTMVRIGSAIFGARNYNK
ncbi:YggS family pyridoxal phosphate enzyme [Patiriisocius marinus]|uniref:Pyridoxal phosphate homeostasis protein n=1 Tax=Patiriisocius marinus TaxID=1397112 RepID=A0A5J4J509_9FLAO|nr:YggS family pyridoxal phosphate-dependent enzyme [Patiriisocius marinus]GER60871.1 YggS family pyridoxal phosphate enzyme [Patiriisocius marinus]